MVRVGMMRIGLTRIRPQRTPSNVDPWPAVRKPSILYTWTGYAMRSATRSMLLAFPEASSTSTTTP